MKSCWYLESLLKADFQDDSKNNNLRLQQSNHDYDCHLHSKLEFLESFDVKIRR